VSPKDIQYTLTIMKASQNNHYLKYSILVLSFLLLFCIPSVGAQDSREDRDIKLKKWQALFESLSTKVDIHQDLLFICDALKQSENVNAYRENCLPSLEALQTEILDLKKRLEEE
jgi:hypothetical protein